MSEVPLCLKINGGARREHLDEFLLHRLLGRGFDHQHSAETRLLRQLKGHDETKCPMAMRLASRG